MTVLVLVIAPRQTLAQTGAAKTQARASLFLDRDSTFNTPAGLTPGVGVALRRELASAFALSVEFDAPGSTRTVEQIKHADYSWWAERRHRAMSLALIAEWSRRLGTRTRVSAGIGAARAWRRFDTDYRVESSAAAMSNRVVDTRTETLAVWGGELSRDITARLTVAANMRVLAAPGGDFGWSILRPRIVIAWRW